MKWKDMNPSKRNWILLFFGILIFSGFALATTVITDKSITFEKGDIIGLENITLGENHLFIRGGSNNAVRAIFNANASFVFQSLQAVPDLSTSFSVTSFFGNVDNFDNIDDFSRFKETNVNNGSSAVAGFQSQNDLNHTMNFGITSSTFVMGNMSLPNTGVFFSLAPGGTAFTNFLNQGYDWFTNTEDSVVSFNFSKIASLDEKGNFNISGNFIGDSFYGEMFIFNNSVPTPIASANTFVNATPFEVGDVNGFSFNDDSLITVVPGKYFVSYALSYTDGNNEVFDSTIGINNAEQANCQSRRKIQSMDVGHQGASCIISISNGDRITLMVKNLESSSDLIVIHAQVTLYRLGN